MAYYLDTDDRELLDKLRRTSVCKECGEDLEMFFDMQRKLPYLQCKKDASHNGIARAYEHKELNILARRERMVTEHGVTIAGKIERSGLPTSGRLNEQQAMAILQLVYPGVPDIEIKRAALICRDFGLHPLMKEVYVIPFKKKWKEGDQWKEKTEWTTVIGITATRKMFASRGSFSYTDNTPRIMTEAEQNTIFGEVDKVNIVAITKLRTLSGLEAQGYGKWPRGTDPYGTDKGNSKANMAFIRSERNAFSRLFPDAKMPDADVIDDNIIDVPGTGKVNTSTGEVVEGTIVSERTVEPPPASPPAPAQAVTEAGGRDIEVDKRMLFSMVKSNMKLKTNEAACTWLENVAKVDMARLDIEPDVVFKEVSVKYNWGG